MKLYIWLSTTKWIGRHDRRSCVAGSHVSQERALYCSSTNLPRNIGIQNGYASVFSASTFNRWTLKHAATFTSIVHKPASVWNRLQIENSPWKHSQQGGNSNLCTRPDAECVLVLFTWVHLRSDWSRGGGSVCCAAVHLIALKTHGGAKRPERKHGGKRWRQRHYNEVINLSLHVI